MTPTIMIIGASGRLGLSLIRAAAAHPSKPAIHAFVRTPSKIPPKEYALCETVQKGDALHVIDIEQALEATNPDTVIVSIGVPNSIAKSQLRQNSAKALMSVISPGSKYEHIRVVCVSSVGAGGSKINIGFGIGLIVAFRLRKVLSDHDFQEEVFVNGMGPKNANRLLIVRPTALIDGKPGGKLVTFGNEEKAPSFSIDRDDVASYITGEVCNDGKMFGKAVNIGTVV